MSKLHELAEAGQAIWIDYIKRSMTTNGELVGLVDQGLRGLTSNPSIFQNAIAGSEEYDADIRALAAEGKSVDEIYETLAIDDLRRATDILRPVYDATNGADGFASLEVDPRLAHDTENTISQAKRLFATVDRPNLMIKVPGTSAGLPAISELIGSGINVNVTLIFSVGNYRKVADAYLDGLRRHVENGGDPKKVASVASFFVSRIDSAVDGQLERLGNSELQGKTAIANAKIAYAAFQEIFSGDGWDRLAKKGARVQRPLWASTSTKNPSYSETIYVDTLIGPETVNTLPPNTLKAFLNHGEIAQTLADDLAGAQRHMQALANAGVNLSQVTDKLQADGVAAFEKAFNELIASIADKRERIAA